MRNSADAVTRAKTARRAAKAALLRANREGAEEKKEECKTALDKVQLRVTRAQATWSTRVVKTLFGDRLYLDLGAYNKETGELLHPDKGVKSWTSGIEDHNCDEGWYSVRPGPMANTYAMATGGTVLSPDLVKEALTTVHRRFNATAKDVRYVEQAGNATFGRPHLLQKLDLIVGVPGFDGVTGSSGSLIAFCPPGGRCGALYCAIEACVVAGRESITVLDLSGGEYVTKTLEGILEDFYLLEGIGLVPLMAAA